MASILYKWLIALAFSASGNGFHPIFVSVTEIEYNAAGKTLEISCKIFTDDLETALRAQNNTKIDLLDSKYREAMNPLVDKYIQKHLTVLSNGAPVIKQFLGFEKQEEGIVSYFEVKGVTKVKKIDVVNDILYEFHPQQMGIIHVMVNGERKSSRLNNPEDKAGFDFD